MFGQSVEGALRHLLTAGPLLVAFTWTLALAGAAAAYVSQADGGRRSLRGLFRFCVPEAILRHPSCRLDLTYAISAKLLYPVAIAPLLLGNVVIATGVHALLSGGLGAPEARVAPPGAGA